MSEVIKYFVEVSPQMPQYAWYIHIAAIVVIFGLVQGIKLPLKKFLTDKIQPESARKKVNMVFMVLPFGVAMLASYVLTFFTEYEFSWEAGIMWGAVSGTFYEFISRIVRRLKNKEEVTEETVKEDFKASKNNTKEAEKTFTELVKKAKKGGN